MGVLGFRRFFRWNKDRGAKVVVEEDPADASCPSSHSSPARRPTVGSKKDMRMMSACIREIQAPVSDLCGLKNIMQDIPKDSPIYQHAKIMNRCGIILADMIENMRLFYTLSADLYEVTKSPFILRSDILFVWESLIDDTERLWKTGDTDVEGGIRMNLEFTKDVPGGFVESDSSCVLKIFKSLVENAIRFTLEGFVSVEVFSEFSDKRMKHGILHIVVSDTGVGIPREARDAIFDPLRKAHAESIEGGVGMGLAVSRSMCEVLGGHLVLEESPNSEEIQNGSSFHAWFPISASNWSRGGVVTYSRTLHRMRPKNTSFNIDTGVDTERSERVLSSNIVDELTSEEGEMPDILLVEDVQLVRTIMSRLMADVHVIVSTAVDGVEAVEACREKKFDLILMDISMPNMGGIEATENIKNFCPFNKNTPIIALTGTNAGMMEAECRKAGMVKCIAKPVRRVELVKSVADNVQRKHRLWMAEE